jgi:hypothetical protein
VDLGRLDRRVSRRAGFAYQPYWCRGVLWPTESGCPFRSEQSRRGPDTCQRRSSSCDASCLSNRASPPSRCVRCNRDGSPLFRLLRWRDGPRRCIPAAVGVSERAGRCRAILAISSEDLTYCRPGHCHVPVSIALPQPVDFARSICATSSGCPIAAAIAKTGPHAISSIPGSITTSSSSSAFPEPVWSPIQSVGLQLLRARRSHLQPALQLLRLLQPLRQHFLDGNQWLRRAVRERQVESLGRSFRCMQLQRRRGTLALQRSVALEQS